MSNPNSAQHTLQEVTPQEIERQKTAFLNKLFEARNHIRARKAKADKDQIPHLGEDLHSQDTESEVD